MIVLKAMARVFRALEAARSACEPCMWIAALALAFAVAVIQTKCVG